MIDKVFNWINFLEKGLILGSYELRLKINYCQSK